MMFLLYRLSDFFQSTTRPYYISGQCWAAKRLPHDQETPGRAVFGKLMDWTFEDKIFNGFFFSATLTSRRTGYTRFA